jgi:hypothetical protein
MMYPFMPSSSFDQSKVESTHQIPSPKYKDKGYAKRARVLSKREIKEQLNNPTGFTR